MFTLEYLFISENNLPFHKIYISFMYIFSLYGIQFNISFFVVKN